MESTVEMSKEDETKIFDDQIYTIEDFHGKCEEIKSIVAYLRELEMIGDDITETMQIVESVFKKEKENLICQMNK